MDNSTIGYIIVFGALAIGGYYIYNKFNDKLSVLSEANKSLQII
jgi:hypothetical protein